MITACTAPMWLPAANTYVRLWVPNRTITTRTEFWQTIIREKLVVDADYRAAYNALNTHV